MSFQMTQNAGWSLCAIILLMTGCGSESVKISHEAKQAAPAAKASRQTRGKELPCKIEWQGLSDKRADQGPLGYFGVHAIEYPQVAEELNRQVNDAISRKVVSKQATRTMRLEAELLRAYVENHNVIAVLNMWFRIKDVNEPAEPFVVNTAVRNTVMWGTGDEAQAFVRNAMGESVKQFVAKLEGKCAS